MENNYLRTIVVLALLLVMSIGADAQYKKYWIQFTDKNNNPYSLSNPSAFLSARAIQRRTVQSINYAQNDLPVTPAYVDSIRAVPNVTLINRSKWFNAITIQTTDTNALNKILAFPFVSQVKPVARIKGNRKLEEASYEKVLFSEKKSDPVFSHAYNYGPSFHQINMVNGVCLHNLGYDGAGMIIAVLDAGFYKVDSIPVFDSLWANNQIITTWDFVDNDSTVFDTHTHGTMVLSLMGGNLPGQLVGTAPKAKYVLLRTEEGATEYVIEEDNWVSGAEFADSLGADVFNTSLGYTEFDSVIINNQTVVNPDNHTYADMDGNTTRITIATDIAASKGILPVNSAGNSGGSPWNFIGAPADADSVLAIGAVDSTGWHAWFSSNGPTSDGRVKPNVAAMGQDVYVYEPTAGIIKGSGTSFSGPIMAGMAASLWQAFPTSTNMDIFNAIQNAGNIANNPDTLTGYGIPNMCVAYNSLGLYEAMSLEGALKVYPNPTSGAFRFSREGEQFFSYTVFNSLGSIVMNSPLTGQGEIRLDLSGVPAGIYLLMARNAEGKNFSARIIRR